MAFVANNISWATKKDTKVLVDKLTSIWNGQDDLVVLEKAQRVLDDVKSGVLVTPQGAHYWVLAVAKSFRAAGIPIPSKDGDSPTVVDRLSAYA